MTTGETPIPASRESLDQWLAESQEVLDEVTVSNKVLDGLFPEAHATDQPNMFSESIPAEPEPAEWDFGVSPADIRRLRGSYDPRTEPLLTETERGDDLVVRRVIGERLRVIGLLNRARSDFRSEMRRISASFRRALIEGIADPWVWMQHDGESVLSHLPPGGTVEYDPSPTVRDQAPHVNWHTASALTQETGVDQISNGNTALERPVRYARPGLEVIHDEAWVMALPQPIFIRSAIIQSSVPRSTRSY